MQSLLFQIYLCAKKEKKLYICIIMIDATAISKSFFVFYIYFSFISPGYDGYDDYALFFHDTYSDWGSVETRCFRAQGF